MSEAQKSTATADITYEDLYRRWEEGNWKATEIDFSQDRQGWEALSEMQRKSALWIYSMFFFGEDSVADNLSPYIDAAPNEDQKYFLATQQVDEARHAIFFHRFFKDVIGAGDSISSTLAFTESHLNWGYRGIFSRLDRMAEELRRDRSLPRFAQAITLYHMIVEGALAQPGQHYIEDYFMKEGTMPGFSSGMVNVSRDEQRHIGFGVKILSELLAESDECKAAVVELLRETVHYTAAVFVPPGWNREYTEAWGFSFEDIFAFGLRLIRQRWRMVGFPMEEMPSDVFPFDFTKSDEQIAVEQIKLLEAGVIGEPNDDPAHSAEIQRLHFELVARTADTAAVNGDRLTYQWRFDDADPWHIVVANGSTKAVPGEAENPTLTLDSTWRDWVSSSMGDGDPRLMMVKRKIRPHGPLRELARMRKVFPS